ncbi:MAG: serine O-acetyltransferase [Thiothrix sp.]|jgi:serine O-acetyltransferase|uniref:serine O-acetyltransferase n=1 Tax=Thiothrix sp. TaxID=1032 RepID=UPI00260F966F|nr:serine O-acetyltransferase [Thiothrix sp.]MDD5394109.1 serine O-acetyltransferase [Thiothrix sp.]
MFSRIREDIHCIFDRDPAARNVFEILTTYPGVHAVLFHRLTHWLWVRDFKWLARLLSNVARLFTGIEIHPGAKIGHRFFIDHGMGVVIGETAEIGDDCTLYHGVTLGGTTWQKGKRHPTLGNDVVIGAGAKILGPITLGNGARVGSNAVVMKDVPEGVTMVGVPGREVTSRKHSEKRREEIARKMGFDAYGATQDMPDPVANAVNRMLDHIHLLDERIDELCSEVQRLGGHVQAKPLPALKAEGFGGEDTSA